MLEFIVVVVAVVFLLWIGRNGGIIGRVNKKVKAKGDKSILNRKIF